MTSLFRNCLSLITLSLLFHPAPAVAQGIMDPPEGSRPGQIFRYGQQGTPAPASVTPYQQGMAPVPQTPASAAAPAVAVAGRPVIMEFSDLQCPDSARFGVGLKSTIMQRYVTTGRAEFEWRDFPLPKHAQAVDAATAARCAGPAAEQVRRQILANQGNMSSAAFTQYATQSGVDQAAFATCMRSGQARQTVMADKALGDRYGVRGTPTLVLGVKDAQGNINPVRVVKAYDPPQTVLAEIDAFLASQAPARPAN